MCLRSPLLALLTVKFTLSAQLAFFATPCSTFPWWNVLGIYNRDGGCFRIFETFHSSTKEGTLVANTILSSWWVLPCPTLLIRGISSCQVSSMIRVWSTFIRWYVPNPLPSKMHSFRLLCVDYVYHTTNNPNVGYNLHGNVTPYAWREVQIPRSRCVITFIFTSKVQSSAMFHFQHPKLLLLTLIKIQWTPSKYHCTR